MRKVVVAVVLALVLLAGSVFPVLAQDNEAEQGLTLEMAIDMALKNSVNLKLADYDVDRSNEVKEKAEQQANITVPPGPITVGVWTVVTNAHLQDLSWRMAQKTRDITWDTVVMSAFQGYIDVLKAQQELANAEKTFEKAALNQKLEEVRHRVGVSSSFTLSQVQAQYAAAKAALEAATKGLDTAYQNLNYLLGLQADKRLPLVDKPQYTPLIVTDLYSTIERTIADSPATWLKDSSVDMNKMIESIYDWSTATEPYAVKQIDVDKAELSATDARAQTRLLLQSLYAAIMNLEVNYVAADLGLKTAQEGLRIQQLMFVTGLGTKAEVLAAEEQVAKAQKALDDLVYQHEILKLTFEKPWTYAAAMAGA